MWRFAGLVAASTAFLLAGCQMAPYGASAHYHAFVEPKHDVVLPAGTPSITQQFRPYKHRETGPHNGIDITGARGSPVLAAAAGTVVKSFRDPAYGNTVVIDHGRDETGKMVHTAYRHLHERMIAKGAPVKRGQQIASMGSTGFMGLAVHLHFELLQEQGPGDLDPVDPHGFWLNGAGRVTCFARPGQQADTPFRLTYPVPCAGP